jgi:hypothetical protein
MAEAMQIRRLMIQSRTPEYDQKTLCRILKNATELSQAGKEYFPACDPHGASRGHVLITEIESGLAKEDISSCLRPAKAGAGKK